MLVLESSSLRKYGEISQTETDEIGSKVDIEREQCIGWEQLEKEPSQSSARWHRQTVSGRKGSH